VSVFFAVSFFGSSNKTQNKTLPVAIVYKPDSAQFKSSGCLQAERILTISKRKFLNKFSVIHNAFVFVAIAKTELESCCTDVYLSD